MVTSLMVADASIVNLYGSFVREGMKHEVSGTDWRCPSRSGDTLTYSEGWLQDGIPFGPVEKVRQRRSRAFVVLTYSVYAPGAKAPAALLDLAPPERLRAGERAFLNRPLAGDDSGNWSDGVGALKILNYSTVPIPNLACGSPRPFWIHMSGKSGSRKAEPPRLLGPFPSVGDADPRQGLDLCFRNRTASIFYPQTLSQSRIQFI